MMTQNVDELRLVVFGSRGRMGQRVCRLARDDQRFRLVDEVNSTTTKKHNSPDEIELNVECDIVVDFSSDQGAYHAAQHAAQHSCALLVGTTALSQQTTDIIEFAAKKTAVMIASNTAPGMSICMQLIIETARRLGGDYDIDLIEKHHAHKRDQPSGTALNIVKLLRDHANVELSPAKIHSVRSGEIVGEHTVEFSGYGEQIKISHFVSDRDVFARGALNAAVWLTRQKPGLYTMNQARQLSLNDD